MHSSKVLNKVKHFKKYILIIYYLCLTLFPDLSEILSMKKSILLKHLYIFINGDN